MARGVGSSISIGGNGLKAASLGGSGLFVNSTGSQLLRGYINEIDFTQIIIGQGSPQFVDLIEIDLPTFSAGGLYTIQSQIDNTVSAQLNLEYLIEQFSDLDWSFSGSDEDDSITVTTLFSLSGDDTFEGLGGDDIIQGGDGADVISGDGGADILFGDNGGDTITGDEDNDILFGGAGNDTITGGEGIDFLYGGDDDDLLVSDDLPVAFFAETAASVYRLYQATLGREPDANGHQNWTTRLELDGLTLLEAANGFVGSLEFQNTYGSLGDAGFVNLLYQNVLGRDADDAGLARWVGDLETGVSRAQVVLGFSNSKEFKTNTATDAAQFAQGNTQQIWADDVFRLYQATLDRAPDVNGMFNRTERLGSGTEYLDEAAGFVNSTEFKNTYGANLSNADFVELLYQNVLDRSADDAGLARWVSDLENGASRTEVVRGFAQSSEFRDKTADSLEDWMRENVEGDVIDGGAGNDVIAGGHGSDLFIFQETHAGNDRVLNLEAWDSIDVTDFQFADLATAQAAFTQNGANVEFVSGDVQATFENTDIAVFDDDLLILI
ncbi:DUF4214 domain-containing protein [Octadecabacter algicola]|uniref:DUF4214 domain-containing protein n=1 Tax=Octadecabacter algicola TaxID=2909342 RepID=UPI00300C710A